MLFRVLAVTAALGLSGCYRVQELNTPQPAQSGARVALWAVTPEGCQVYIIGGSGNLERVVVCPSTHTVAGFGS